MSLKFTQAQQKAIDTQGKDTLVSAAAGSGKTAVLSARVKRKLKQGTSLNSLVLLTFTNKAAAEMKERIRKIIAQDPALHHELPNVDAAHIKTFDSYALYLLKRYGYLLNIPKTISILDQTDAALIKESIIEEIFIERLQRKDKAFIDLMKRYTDKSDAMLKKNIVGFYDSLSYFKDKTGFEKHLKQHYFSEANFETLFSDYEQNVVGSVKRFLKAIDKLTKKPFQHEKIIEYIQALEETFAPLRTMSDYESIQQFFAQNPRFPRIPSKKDDGQLEEEKTMVKQYKENILDKLLINLRGDSNKKGDAQSPKSEHKEAFLSLEGYVHCVLDIVEEFEKRFLQKQHELQRFDYTGVARNVIKIIEEFDEVKTELCESINEIMVDEYQDTNAMQEHFLQLVKNNNLYMVGDIKQSIYRFRNAEPSIFASKYLRFKQSDFGEVIDLNLNFRSRKEVLKDINILFERVMDAQVGGVDYDEAQALKFGNQTYETSKAEHPYGITFDVYEAERFEECFDQTFTKKEAELMHIAKSIKADVNSKRLKTKTSDGLRDVEYGDYAILLDRGSSFEDARRIFEYVGVPLTVHKSVMFTDFPEIMMSKQLLNILLSLHDFTRFKAHFKRSFMSITRSFVFDYTDDEIVSQLLDLNDDYHSFDALIKDIHSTFKPLMHTLHELSMDLEVSRLDVILLNVLDAFSVYEKMVKIPNTQEGIARLDYLLELAQSKMNEGLTLSDFIEYFNALTASDLGIELALRSDFSKDKVNLMTMHKSKGLEFPYVYLAHLENTFTNVIDSNMLISEDLGILLPYDNQGDDKHFLYSLYRNQEKLDDISERLRVLYVALTRAEEGVFIVYCEDDSYEARPFEGIVDLNKRMQYRSFHDVFKSVLACYTHHKRTIDIGKYQADTAYKQTLNKKVSPDVTPLEKTYLQKPRPAKPQSEKSFSSTISELLSEHALAAIDQGNLLHDTLEQLDFFSDIEAQLSLFDLNEKDKETIKAFFETDLMRALNIKQVYKEYPFAYESESGNVSGFIDLLIETDDAFYIIDYKLKDIDKPHYEDQINGYVTTLKSMTDKSVYGYLYSIIEKYFKQVA